MLWTIKEINLLQVEIYAYVGLKTYLSNLIYHKIL